MAKTRLKLVSPATVKRTVAPPRRRPNAELRPREHLTEREVEKLIEAAKGNRHGGRDSAMILVCFRHGLRASEVCELQWSDVEFETGTLHLRRAKGGQPAPIRCWAMKCGHCGRSNARPSRPSSSSASGERPSPCPACRRWSSGPGSRPSCPSRCIRTCCAMPPAMRWRTRAPTPGRCKRTSAIARSNRPCVTPN